MATPTRTRRRRRACAVLAAAALVVAACGNSDDDDAGSTPTTAAAGDDTATSAAAGDDDTGGDDTAEGNGEFQPIEGVPGVSDDEIHFAAFGTQANNPLGTCVLDCYVNGINAYFEFRNSQGGVNGRQLVLTTILDDELSNNQQRALEVVSANDTFAAFSATQVPTGWADVADAGIPLYTWSIHPAEMAGQPGIFGYTGALCTSCIGRIGPYIGTVVGATRVGTLGYGVSPNSQECANASAAAVDRYGAETGQEAVYTNDDLAFGLPNGIAPEVTAMKDAGVDFIIGCIDLNGMKSLAQELERQGMGDVPMYHPNTYNADFVAEAGELFEGDVVGVSFRPFEADPGDSQLADFQEWMGELGAEVSEIAMIGWLNADLAYQGILAAGPQFDRQSVIDATNQFTDYTAGGLIPPIDWTRQHEPWTDDDPATHGPAFECAALVRIVSGAFELIGEPDAPWSCWDGANRDWSEPTPMNFD